ncbi:phage major tail tube protein [Hydrogenovibrio sp. 3SP14C1]|uniref:phage major tail tube protein n=1 Tax=Hydrogenovibrio sp. 3SP14C1 TaxID=3038774 RepID=UPI002416824A|nr:phage major tail tube protein [Hydrogenovibrio sp. 3SP14C1]MDG4811655.1 phage major tail tube protein [Hydrogenovibrio sp. 3SP14C1]
MDNVLKNFNLQVDGKGYAGEAEEIELPKLVLIMESFRAGGMDASKSIDMGMEEMEATITLSGYDPALLKLWGVTSAAVPLTARGALQSEDGTVTAAVINMQAQFFDLDLGTWKPGDKAPKKMKCKVSYYKMTIGGEETIEIDVPNMVRKIGGVDQLEQMRAALGI